MPEPDHDPFKDLVPKPTEDDIFFMTDELKELGLLIRRNDQVVVSGAPVIAWWGFCAALAAAWNFFEQVTGLFDFPVWIVNVVMGYGGMAVIVRIMGTARVLKLEYQAITAAWVAIALGMPILYIGLEFREVDQIVVLSGMQSLMFAGATGVTAMASRQRWLLWPAFGWGAMAFVMFFVANDYWRPLLFSLACLAFMTAPGLYLWRNSRKAPL